MYRHRGGWGLRDITGRRQWNCEKLTTLSAKTLNEDRLRKASEVTSKLCLTRI